MVRATVGGQGGPAGMYNQPGYPSGQPYYHSGAPGEPVYPSATSYGGGYHQG
jgi:hypothetical protein